MVLMQNKIHIEKIITKYGDFIPGLYMGRMFILTFSRLTKKKNAISGKI